MKVKKAVVPVAGLGTRLLPATKVVPKELIPLIDKPAIQYIVEELVSSGIEDIIFVTCSKKKAIKEYFSPDSRTDLLLERVGKEHLVEELRALSRRFHLVEVFQEETKGLGHAVYQAKEVVGVEPFIVVLPDDIIYSKVPAAKQHIDAFCETGFPVIALLTVAENQAHLYGIAEGIEFEKNAGYGKIIEIKKLIEKPVPGTTSSRAAVIGRYVLTPDIFGFLEKTKRGHSGEIQLTDALIQYLKKDKLYGLFFDGIRYDVGDRIGFLKANLAFALRDKRYREELSAFIREVIVEDK